MATIDITQFTNAYEVIPPTSSPTPDPDKSTDVLRGGSADTVRTYIRYEGIVTEVEIRLWYWDGLTWYRANSTSEAPLVGSGFGNEVRDWEVGENARFTFTIEKVAGGGKVSVRVTEGNHNG